MDPRLTPSTDVRLARRDAVLAGVARASAWLSEPQPWEHLVPEALAFLGDAAGVSRVYVFEVEVRDGREVVNQRFEWCAPGVEPQIDNPDLQGVPMEGAFGRWGDVLRTGGSLYGDIQDFPSSEQPLLESQGIKSLIVQPVFAGTRWWGFIGFDACDQAKSWERLEVDTLHIASLLLGAAIHRQEREELLRHSQKLEVLGRVAGSVAHDLNNFLTVIAGAKQMLEDELALMGSRTAVTDSLCSMLDHAVTRADALTKRLLAFSRRHPSAPVLVSPMKLVREDEPLLKQAVRHRATLQIIEETIRRPIAPVAVDPTQFSQVLLNLVVNSRDAMPDGGQLTIHVSTVDSMEQPAFKDEIPEGSWSLIRVSDTGSGMPPDVLASAFEPFFTTKSRERGTGLGLATVKGVVEGARGHIRVSSRVGIGTEFRIYLPAAGDAASGERLDSA